MNSNLTLIEAVSKLKNQMAAWQKLVQDKMKLLDETIEADGTEGYNNELAEFLKDKLENLSHDTITSFEDFQKQIDIEKDKFNDNLKNQKEDYLNNPPTELEPDLNTFKSHEAAYQGVHSTTKYETLKEFSDSIIDLINKDKAEISEQKNGKYNTISAISKNEGIQSFFDENNKEITDAKSNYQIEPTKFEEMLINKLKAARKRKVDEEIERIKEEGITIGPEIIDEIYEKISNGDSLPNILQFLRTAANDARIAQLHSAKRQAYEQAKNNIKGIQIGGLTGLEPEKSSDSETIEIYKGKLNARIKELKNSQDEFDKLKDEFEKTLEEIKKLDPKSHRTFAAKAKAIFEKEYEKEEDFKKEIAELQKNIDEMTTEIIDEVK